MFMPTLCMFTSELIIPNGVFKEEQEGTLSVVVVNELLYKQEVRMHEPRDFVVQRGNICWSETFLQNRKHNGA